LPDIKRNRKILLKEVISEIQSEDLRNFIHNYAKKDKGFELALKAHFISRIQLADQDMKYRRILNELIRPKTTSNNKIGQSERKTIGIILNDFTDQMSDLLSKEDYKESFFIIKNSLDKIAYAQTQFGIRDKTMEEARKTFLSGLELILREEIAPGFRAQAEQELLELVSKSYYLPKEKNIITVLNTQEVLTSEDKKLLIDSLLQKRVRIDDNELLIQILVGLAYPFPDLIQEVRQEFNQHTLFLALLNLLADGQMDIVTFVLDSKEVGYSYNREIIEILLLDKKKEFKKLTRYLSAIRQPDIKPRIFKKMIEDLSDKFLREEAESLTPWINQLSTSHKCQLFARGKNHDKLIAILKEQSDLEWLKAYDRFLLDEGKAEEVKQLYQDLAERHLETHMGKQARDFLDKFEQRLRYLGEDEMLFDIKESLMILYGNRKAFTIF